MTLTIAVIVASLVVSFGTFIGILAAMQKGLLGRLLDLLINVTLVVPGLPLGRRDRGLRTARSTYHDYAA